MNNDIYAGFWIRVGAALIDTVAVLLIIAGPLMLIYGVDTYLGSDQMILGFWDVVISYIFPFAITVWLWLKIGATPGKMLLGLRVVDAQTGDNISTVQAIGRYLAYFPAMIVLGLGIIWVAFDKKKQGWHDKMAGTAVIRAIKNQSPK